MLTILSDLIVLLSITPLDVPMKYNELEGARQGEILDNRFHVGENLYSK